MANGLAAAGTELEKMQSVPVEDVVAQLAQIEQRILRELRDLRADFARAYAHLVYL